MVRFYLLAPALALLATFVVAFIVYVVLCAAGRAPTVRAVKHNELLGPFVAGFLVWLIGPIERLLIGRVSPNTVTLASVALCAVTGVAAALGHLPGAVWLYAFAGILDMIDGRLARQAGQQTAAGALFDSVSDRWGELFVFAGYGWFLHDSIWVLAVFAALGGSMMVSYTRARAEGLGLTSIKGGLMQRAERIVLVTGGTLLAAWYDVDDMATAVTILGATLLLCGVASTGTALNRLVSAYRELAARQAAPAAARAPKPLAPAPARALEQH